MEQVKTYNITYNQFETWFWDFKDVVERWGDYEKIPYGTWRALRDELLDESFQDFTVEVVERDNSYSCPICVTALETGNDYMFMSDDESFGSFIMEELRTKKIEDSYYENLRNKSINTINNSKNTESEKKTMKNFNFDFGPVNNDQVRLSMYGVAVKNLDGVWVSYDKAGNQVMDVDILNFESGNFLYRIPVAIKDIAVGDVVIHAHKPMFVTGIKGSNVEAVDVIAGEAKTILPTKNMFGFDFVTKVVSLVDFGNPNADNPFGNMLPFLLMSNEDGAIDKNVLMALAFGGGAIGGTDFMKNPLLMMALCGKDGDKSNLGLLFAMNAMNPANRPVCQCQCGTEAPAHAKAE